MLIPSQVIPFLQHRDAIVRELAVRYFSRAHDHSPATADDFWAASDRWGPEFYYVELPDLPQTENSLRRTLAGLESEEDQNRRYHLEEVLSHLSYGLLLRFGDLVEGAAVLSQALRDNLQQRFALATVPPMELWEQLIEHASSATKDRFPNADHAWRLIEALARHPEAAGWAISTLNDPSIIDWRELYSVRLLGQMRHRQAVELLVNKLMSDEDADFLLEWSVDALARIGSVDAVRLIHERFDRMPWGIRLHASSVLGRIKLPQSESAARVLLERESNAAVRTDLAMALCELAANEPPSLERLRQVINDGNWDRSITDLKSDAAALFTMVGHDAPELPTWQAHAADRQARSAARQKEMSELFRVASKVSSSASAEPVEWDEEVPPWEAGQQTVQQSEFTAPKTIRRETPKVGRNDPCPCGSGKKYKKCCGK